MSENMTMAGGGDRRKDKRYGGGSHPAVLKIEGLSAFDCNIGNFCESGFYISANDNDSLRTILPMIKAGASLVVDYERGTEQHSIAGQIARLDADGVGVHAPGMNQEQFRALVSGKIKSGEPTNASGVVSGSQQLISECRECLFDFASKFSAEFFERAEKDLKSALEEASFSKRPEYQFSLNSLLADPSRTQSAFQAALRETVTEFELGRASSPEKASQKTSNLDELSLVDEKGFEKWLAVSSIAYRIDGELRQEMTGFEQRYSRISGYSIDRSSTPYGPEVICSLFDEQLKRMDLSEEGDDVIRKTLYKVLLEGMRSLYEELKEVVASVEPSSSSASGEAAADSSPSMERADSDTEQPTEDAAEEQKASGDTGSEESNTSSSEGHQSGDQPVGGSPAADGQPGGSSTTSGGHQSPPIEHRPVPKGQREYSFENLFRAIQRRSDGDDEISSPSSSRPSAAGVGAGAGAGAGAGGAASTGGSSSGVTEGAPRQSGGQGIASAFAGMRKASKSNVRQIRPRPAGEPAPKTGEVVNLVDQIEKKARFEGDGGSSLPLSRRLTKKMDETALGALDDQSREQLSTVAEIVDRAVAEYLPTSQIEALVVALEKPLLKLVLVEPEFLDDESHPARRFTNMLDQFAIAADDDGNFYDTKLFQFLDSVIGAIVKEPIISGDIFETSLEQISDMLLTLQQLRLKRVSLLQESSEARERVRTARQRTVSALDEALSGKEVPVSALDLLDIGWRHYLNLIELRETFQSETWSKAFDLFTQVCQWLSGDRLDRTSAGGKTVDENALNTLLHEIEIGLSKVSTDTDGVESFISAIKTEVQAAAVNGPAATSHYAAVDAEKTSAVSQIGIARIGEWWSVPVADKKIITQLIWRNDSGDKYSVTNRSASRRWELNAAQFERDIASGKVSRIGEGQFLLFERSEGALFDDLYKRLSARLLEEEHVGAINRKGFLKKLDHVCAKKDATSVLCMVEFDQFRVIRHNFGLDACDDLSLKLLDELQEALSPTDIVSAFTQDSFMILMQNCDQQMAEVKAEKILDRYRDYKHNIGTDAYRLGVNIGMAVCVTEEEGADISLRRTDSACMASKDAGRNHVQFYDPANKQLKVQESVMELAGRIDRIIAGGGLYLRAQMVVPVGDEEGLSPYHEILLGINDEQGRRVVPEKFVQAIETLRRADELDMWVINKTFSWIRENPEQFQEWGGFSINMSGASLGSQKVLDLLLTEIPKLGVPATLLTFEITETATIENYDSAKDFLWEVRRLGCLFSLDDFGTGYASYSHLRKLRPDILKIDGSFVWNLATDNNDFVLVKSANEIGKALGFKTVAEYVESPAILAKLAEIGVDYAQGYTIHRPEPLEEMAKRAKSK